MPDTFTPEQIAQILEEFFKVVGTRQYIGARYVPIFGRKDEESIEWDNTAPYEPLTIVLYQGNSYTSRQYVPVGVEITNQEFWAITGNYNAQIELYRRETAAAREIAEAAQNDIDTLLPKDDFSAENTVKDYVDAIARNTALIIGDNFSPEHSISDFEDAANATLDGFDAENTVKKYIDENITRVLSFDTVADMQASVTLKTGMVCHTNGFHAVNDNGAAFYIIGETGAANGMDVIACGELFASLVKTDAITPEQFGAWGDGVRDDSGSISKALTYDAPLVFSEKTYAIGSTLVLNKTITFPAETRIKAIATMNAMVEFSDATATDMRLNGGILDCNELADYGIYAVDSVGRYINGVTVYDANIASVYFLRGTHSWLLNSKLYNPKTLATCVIDNCADLKVIGCELYYTNLGIDLQTDILLVANTHIWAGGAANPNQTTYGIKVHDNTGLYFIHATLCYFDSLQTAIDINSSGFTRLSLSSCIFLWAETTVPTSCVGIVASSGLAYDTVGCFFSSHSSITVKQMTRGGVNTLVNTGLASAASYFEPDANLNTPTIFTAYADKKTITINFVATIASLTTDATSWYPIFAGVLDSPYRVVARTDFTLYNSTKQKALQGRYWSGGTVDRIHINGDIAVGDMIYGSITTHIY